MKFIAGFIVALMIIAGASLLIMYTGSYNVAANVPDNPALDWFLTNTMTNSVINRARSVQAPAQFTEQQAKAGFTIYNQTCIHCHGAPGRDPGDNSQGSQS